MRNANANVNGIAIWNSTHKLNKKKRVATFSMQSKSNFLYKCNQNIAAIVITDAEICFWQNCIRPALHTSQQNHFESFFISNANGFIIKKNRRKKKYNYYFACWTKTEKNNFFYSNSIWPKSEWWNGFSTPFNGLFCSTSKFIFQ